MPDNVTLIGLGAFGSFLAKSLKARESSPRITGSDLEHAAEKAAEAQRYADRIEHNAFSAVKGAELIVLAVPADQTRETLRLIGKDVRPDAVILDCCPAKKAAAGWAKQYLAHPENFTGIWAGTGTLFIAADTAASKAAVRTASDFAKMLGLKHSFADPEELDGLISAVYDLPVLAAHGLISFLSKRPGWTDTQKTADQTLQQMTDPVRKLNDRDGSGTAFFSHRETCVRALDDYIKELSAIRELIRRGDESGLRSLLDEDRDALEQWESGQRSFGKDRENAPDTAPMTAAGMMNQTFFGGLLRRKKRN